MRKLRHREPKLTYARLQTLKSQSWDLNTFEIHVYVYRFVITGILEELRERGGV